MKTSINMMSSATSVKGQGVGSAYIEQVALVKGMLSDKFEVTENKRIRADITHYHTLNPNYYLTVKSRTKNGKSVIKLSQESADIVADISKAAEQQAEAVKQVTVGIERISQVIATNSATAEQSAASCEELSAQAQILKEQLDRLKI